MIPHNHCKLPNMLLKSSIHRKPPIAQQCNQNHEQRLRSLTSTSIGGCTTEKMIALGRVFSRKLPPRGMNSSPAAQLLTAREQHITWHDGGVSREAKEALLNQRGCVVWFTGLSGSGKSTVACTVEHALYRRGITTALLDGDNIRHGLNCNLGFSEEERAENIRRVGEVTKLFVETGVIALASFISPYRADRDRVRQRMGARDFIEVHMKVPLEVCESRDCKGLYKLARSGKIKCFTGIDDPYEAPEHPEITLDVNDCQGRRQSPEAMARVILTYLEEHGYLRTSLSNNAVNGPPRGTAGLADRKLPAMDYSI